MSPTDPGQLCTWRTCRLDSHPRSAWLISAQGTDFRASRRSSIEGWTPSKRKFARHRNCTRDTTAAKPRISILDLEFPSKPTADK